MDSLEKLLLNHWSKRMKEQEEEYDKLFNPIEYPYIEQYLNLLIKDRLNTLCYIIEGQDLGIKQCTLKPEDDKGKTWNAWIGLGQVQRSVQITPDLLRSLGL